MRVTLKLYATLSDHLPSEAAGSNALQLDVPEGTTVDAMIERFNLPRKLCHLVLIDGTFIPPGERATRALAAGETLAIWPPIAGG
jgi:sulfur carrier protein ThiS